MFTPSEPLLKKYSDVLIKYALWGGEGVRKGDVVCLQVPESAKPMLKPLVESVLEAGAHPMTLFIPEGVERSFYEHASVDQIIFFPKKYLLARVEEATHFVAIIATNDKFELKGIDSNKIMMRGAASKFYIEARELKENAGNLSWTLGLYGTDAMASEVGMTTEQYWEQIISACFLDEDDPVARWKEVGRQMEFVRQQLTDMKIEKVHLEGDDVDLWISLGADRKWLGGGGRNIPSFELFVTPDWRGTNGWVKFNQPLYEFGNLVKGIELTFKDGIVDSVKAEENEQLIREMISVENANKVGEFSLTDRRFSNITRFMGETLYDENAGGDNGNFHIALGLSYKDSYPGDPSVVTKEQWESMGYNDSVIHTDIVSTSNRTVTAHLSSGKEKVIYQNGQFTLPLE